MKTLASIFLVTFFYLGNSLGFPEMVRHGYPNCISCHVSTSGGGVLTEYGRALSKELLSSWGAEGEEKWFYIIKSPKWLALGGDYRGINIQKSDSNATTNKYIQMQRDMEVAVRGETITGVASLGVRDTIPPESGNIFSRRHYLNYSINKDMLVRAGRFYPSFGIYIPEHNTSIRRALNWDEGMESYNIELSLIKENYNLFVTGVLGRPDFSTLYREMGGAVSFGYNIGESHKVGLSYYLGQSDLWNHHYFGPWGIFGFSTNLYLLSQFTGTWGFYATAPEPQKGLVDYQKLGYEIIQGLHVFVTQEFAQLDFTKDSTRTDIYGAGIQFFPRPHFDFQAYFQKKYVNKDSNPTNIFGLLLHFYP